VIVDPTCLDNSENSCLNDCVNPKFKESGTQGKFVPTCHHCGIIGHIRQNCYLLKSQKPWNKQDAPKKGSGEKPSLDKYVPLHKRHISQRGKDFVICKNANLNSTATVKKHSNKRSMPICHHCGIIGHI
jgi:hypothetical protein